MDEKPTSNQIMSRAVAVGLVWGVGWTVMFYLLITLSGSDRPFMQLITHGLFFGVLSGIIHSVTLSSDRPSSSIVPTCIMALIFPFCVWFLAPSLEYLFANVLAVVIGSAGINYFALKPNTSPVFERKEKRKNS